MAQHTLHPESSVCVHCDRDMREHSTEECARETARKLSRRYFFGLAAGAIVAGGGVSLTGPLVEEFSPLVHYNINSNLDSFLGIPRNQLPVGFKFYDVIGPYPSTYENGPRNSNIEARS